MIDRYQVRPGRVIRRIRGLVSILGLLALSVCFAAAAGAQVSTDGADNPEADRYVTEGIAMRAEGKDAEALKLFEKAAELDPGSVRVRIHLATVHQALGNWLLADDYLTL